MLSKICAFTEIKFEKWDSREMLDTCIFFTNLSMYAWEFFGGTSCLQIQGDEWQNSRAGVLN